MARVQAEEFLNRFRSKEDLYRYMVQQCKLFLTLHTFIIGGCFLPTMAGTRMGFLRELLRDEKMALK